MDFIEYKGKNYPTRDVYLEQVGTINVSTEALSVAICPDGEWSHIGIEEQYIDEHVGVYAPDDLVENGSDEELYNFVNQKS